MLYATSMSGQKIAATPGQRAQCPGCGEPVISKCGQINIWHWAHESQSQCDSWSEPETLWHLQWKSLWPAECVEISIEKQGIKHRADVLTPQGTVIELQHSSISVDEIRERERFYGKMIWVFDIQEPYKQDYLHFNEKDAYYTFRWKHPRKHLAYTSKESLWDGGEGWLFLLKKMYSEAPCRGWGKLVQKHDFVEHHAATPAQWAAVGERVRG